MKKNLITKTETKLNQGICFLHIISLRLGKVAYSWPKCNFSLHCSNLILSSCSCYNVTLVKYNFCVFVTILKLSQNIISQFPIFILLHHWNMLSPLHVGGRIKLWDDLRSPASMGLPDCFSFKQVCRWSNVELPEKMEFFGSEDLPSLGSL